VGYSLSTSPKSTGTDLIRNKLANPAALRSLTTERVASILERDLDATIQDWTALVEHDEELNRIPLGFQDRSEHLPRLPNDLISRLLLPSLGNAISIDAREHADEVDSQFKQAMLSYVEPGSARPAAWGPRI
jgi:hypothetical protein